MNNSTRYYLQLNQILKFLNQKLKKLKDNFLPFLFILFFGFFLGSLFGTLVDSIRQLNITDNFLIFILLLLIEFINFLVYRCNQNQIHSVLRTKFYNLLNILKIGILLGFFIDSFKVGS